MSDKVNRKFLDKKRLMYIAGNDFYLYTYSIFNILYALKCTDKDNLFHDHRKLPFYINFCNNNLVADVYHRHSKTKVDVNDSDRQLLINCFYNSLNKDKVIYRLLLILEDKGLINITKSENSNFLDLYLVESEPVKKFVLNPLFEIERQNIKQVNSFYNRGHKVKYETAMNSLFYKFKVGKWLL